MPSLNDTPTALLAALVGSDPTRPRLTWYDDQTGPTQGERIELSGRVLGNWAAKAANLLQDELDAGPGTVVEIDLPTHWRAAYWLFAAWSVGAEVVVGASLAGHHPDVVVTDDPGDWAGGGEPLVAVTLASLARGWAGAPLPAGAIDEAKELATYGDRFQAYTPPAPEAVALRTPVRTLTYAEVGPAARAAAASAGLVEGARGQTSATPDRFVETLLAAWVVDGSVVLVRPDQGQDGTDAGRALAERVTHTFG